MDEKRIIINLERYKRCLSNISKIFKADICFLDEAGNCKIKSYNGHKPGFPDLTPEILQKAYKEVKKSGIPFSKNGKNNSFGIVGVPVGTWPHLRGILVAGYGNGMNKGVPASVRNLQDMLTEISVFIDDETSLQQDLDSLTNELSTRYEELTLIYGVGDKLKVAEDSYSTIRYIINEALCKLHGNASILYVPDLGIIEILLSGIKYSKDDLVKIVSHVKRKCNTGKDQIVINSLRDFRSIGFKDKNWFKFIATPVQIKGESKGMFLILSNTLRVDYSTSDLKLLQALSGQISIIITNDELYYNLKNFLMNFVKTMVSAIEAKDSYTRGHSERVNKISIMIARAMGLSQKDIENVSWASILHDVGKIGVSDKILTKPGSLNREEYNIVKTHPEKGYEIMRHIEQIQDALPGILYHQERYDGKGYPKGLKGKEIPLYARIIAIADTYDSITSSRAYRACNTHINAIREINRISGTQLDSEIVRVFKEICKTQPDFIRGEGDENKKIKDWSDKLHRT